MRSAMIVAAVFAMVMGPEPVMAMSGYKWKYRPLVVFAESGTNAALAEQRRLVATRRAGLAERDVVVIWVVGDSISAEFGPGPRQSAAALRSRYGAANNVFRAVLVGKDGGAKLSSSMPLGAAGLFATIDAMPMRRDEMRRR